LTGASALVQMQLLWARIFGIHVHHDVGICGKARHLTARIPTFGTVCVRFDEFPDVAAVRASLEGIRDVLAHELVDLFDSLRRAGRSHSSVYDIAR
jgi:hypothetical protein